jgi:hypothetical protein
MSDDDRSRAQDAKTNLQNKIYEEYDAEDFRTAVIGVFIPMMSNLILKSSLTLVEVRDALRRSEAISAATSLSIHIHGEIAGDLCDLLKSELVPD